MDPSNKDVGPSWPANLEYYEGWLDAEGKTKTRSGGLQYHDFHDWLDLKGKFARPHPHPDENKASFRILYSPLSNRGPFRLGMSTSVFGDLQNRFNLHESTRHAFLDNNGAFSKFLSTALGTPKKIKRMAMVLKVPNCVNIGYDALSLSYNPEERTVMALYHGVQDWDRLLELLRSKLHLCFHPMFIPTALFSCHRYHLGRYRDIVDGNIFRTEHQIGYAVPGRLEQVHPETSNERLDTPEVGYESIVRRLHSYQTELATMANIGRFSKDCGDSLIRIIQELEIYSPFKDDEYFHSSGEEILQEIEFSRSLAHTLLSQSQSLKERVQSQTNLIFSLISQDDNKVGRSIAEHSAAIAISSKRDSTAMKTVALLTIVFLPATFVATFFSMSMFNWDPAEASGPKISPYIWLYWAISVPLTILTLLIWRFWWKVEDAKHDYQIAKSKQGYGLRNPHLKLEKQKDTGDGSPSYSRNYFQGLATDIWRGTSRFFRYLAGHGGGLQTDEENSSAAWKKE